MSDVQEIIRTLDLQPHPEGGWYRETWRAEAGEGERASATAILFLLESGGRSHWHKVDAAEVWLWHAGSSLELHTALDETRPVSSVKLGPSILAGEIPQHVITPGAWQSAEARHGWALVSCVVSPGFEFEGFTLAPLGWVPGRAG